MPMPKPDKRADISPRDTELHRRKRKRNLAILAALGVLMAVFYLVTVVRIQTGLESAG